MVPSNNEKKRVFNIRGKKATARIIWKNEQCNAQQKSKSWSVIGQSLQAAGIQLMSAVV